MLKKLSLLLAAGLVCCGSLLACEDSIGSADSIQNLVRGDRYVLDVRCQGIDQRIEGTLVRVESGWIVLCTEGSYRNERGLPIMSKLPYVNRLYRNVGVGLGLGYVWVPQAAAQVSGRIRALATDETPKEGSLKTGDEIAVLIVKNGEPQEVRGVLISLDREMLRMTAIERQEIDVSTPFWSDLPWVGPWFQESEWHFTEREVVLQTTSIISVSFGDDHFQRIGVDFE